MRASVVSVCVVGESKGATTQTALNPWHRHRSASTTENRDGLVCLDAFQSSLTMAVQSDLICVNGFTYLSYITFLTESKEWGIFKSTNSKIKTEKENINQTNAQLARVKVAQKLLEGGVGEQYFKVNWSIKVMTVPTVFVGCVLSYLFLLSFLFEVKLAQSNYSKTWQLYSNSWLLTALYSL